MGAGQNPVSGAHSTMGLADGFFIDSNFGLRSVFTVAQGLSLVAWVGLSLQCFPFLAPGALEHRLCSCGAWALLPNGMWNLPGPGIEPHVPCIGRRILNHWTTREVPLMASDLSACHDGDHDTAAHTWRHEHFSNGGSHDRTIFASLGLRLFQAFALHLSLVKAPRFRNKKVREPHRYFREWYEADL